ncbi:MAG: Ig-like domain-containing protein [Bacteroides sp.]|nr:Ig-like domain-containing protein [Bacteroides sp.]MCM1549578.1 Ig-like domain-containing protein [Clostridium sp.]
MKKMKKRVIAGIIMLLLAVLVVGCKAKEPDSGENSDTETEEQGEEQEEGQEEEQEEGQEAQGEEPQKEAAVQLSVYEEAFHTAFSLMVGESRKLKVSTDYDGSLEYQSTDETIATVDQEGTVTAIGAGTVTLTIAAGDVKKDVNVIVQGETADAGQQNGTEDAGAAGTAGNTGRPAVPAEEQNPTAEQTESTTKTNISISTVIVNGEGECITVVPFEQDIEIDNSNPEEYHIEWQYVLE